MARVVADTGWPCGAGEMAHRIRAQDWAASPLGAIRDWPHSLRTMVDAMLAMPGPAAVIWGDARVRLCNDAHAAIAEGGHPALHALPAATEAIEAAFAGRATHCAALAGGGEPRRFDATWSPIRDERGATAGVLETLVEVTDLRRARIALRESETRHRLLLESLAQAVWETDSTGLVQEDSPSWRAYTGQTLEEWLGYGWLDAIHPDDRDYAGRQWREAVAANRLVDAAFRLHAPDGSWRWTHVRAAPVLDEAGQVEKWVGINIDIDVRRRAEERMRESEARLAAVFDALPVGVHVADTEGRTVLANAELKRFLSTGTIPSRDPGGAGRWRGWDADGRPIPPDAFPGARAMRGEAVVPGIEMLFTGDDGEEIWTTVSSTPIRDAAGAVIGEVDVISDIDPLKRSMEAVRASEERLNIAIEVGKVGLWDWDVRTGAVHWSDEHFRMEGLGVGEVTPSYEAWAERLHPDDRARAEGDLHRAMAHGIEYASEFRVVHPDGAIRWLVARGRFFYEAGRPVRMVGAMIDVTERHEWDERQQVLIAELQHRTRNLLGVVRSMADKTARASADLADFGERFHERLEGLSRVQRMLSRLGEPDRVTFDALLRGELAAIHGDGERVTLEGPEGVRLRSSTVQMLAMALHELATNAVKYGALGQPDGRLAVRWWVEPAHDGGRPTLHIDWRESGVTMPTGSPPDGSGQGRELIERALPYQLKAQTFFTLGADGVHCTIAVGASATVASART